MVWEWGIRQSFQWSADEKVPRSESSFSIIIKWERDEKSTVETWFHLSENRSKLFKCQLHTTNYTSQIRFHTFHCCLLKATKMRSVFRNELPLYILCWTKLRNSILQPLGFRKCNKSLISQAAPTKFVQWSLHIRVGYPVEIWSALDRLGRLQLLTLTPVLNAQLSLKVKKNTGIGFNYSRFPHMSIFDVERDSIIHANLVKNEIRSDTLNR